MKIFSGLCLFFSAVSVAYGLGNLTLPIPSVVEILRAEASTGISEKCKTHLEEFLNKIQDMDPKSFWVLQMFDSMMKFPDGIFVGRSTFPGHFDECVEATSEEFQGKHCMVRITFKKGYKNFLSQRNVPGLTDREFRYGLCVPSTCTGEDLGNVIKEVPKLNNYINVKVHETDCSTKDFRPLRSEDWVAVSVIMIILVIALLSTAYEFYQRLVKKSENPSQLWTSFSVYTTGKQLFRVSKSGAQLKCLHGMRFLSMCWVILGHAYFSFLFGAPINAIEIPKFMADKSFTPVSNAFMSVDSFFFLSGLLVCLVFFRDISKKGSYDVPVAFLHRYIRLTPPFALLMLIQGTVISRIGNGPFWNSAIDKVESDCRESWWTGILYVQNYLNPMAMCLGQAWYLSADMQMYWVSPLILYPMLWFPAFAPFFVGLLILAASFTNFTIAYLNKLQPNLLMHWGTVTENQFKLEYAPFHTRMAPWLIGLATGYIICGIQANKIKLRMSKVWVLCGWLAAFGVLAGTVFGVVRFLPDDAFSQEEFFTTAEAALYLAFHRVGWALALGWVVVACVSGHGGPINHFLSLEIFQPLAKLSYCNFLIHMTLQNYRVYSSRTNQYIRHFEAVYAYFGDLIISHIIAIPIVLLFEFPFTNIDRHFLQKLVIFPLPKQKVPEKETVEEKPKKLEEVVEDVEKGKTNPAFSET